MKTTCRGLFLLGVIILVRGLSFTSQGQINGVLTTSNTPPSPADPTTSTVLERGASYKVIEASRQTTNSSGQTTGAVSRFTVLGNGMNRKDGQGNWIECQPVVQSYTGGIVCTGATYRVILNPNLNTPAAVDLETSDGKRIVSHPLGVGFFDPESGRSVLLAQVKDCQAEVNSNRVVYADAFEGNGIEATVTYGYDVGRFHQDVTFVKRPATTPADFGLGSKTRLEMLTEILESPEPIATEHALKRETNSLTRASMAEPDVIDERLSFGAMRMPLGWVFSSAADAPQRRIPVTKRLMNVDGRIILSESVEWNAVRTSLEHLAAQSAGAAGSIRRAGLKRELPASAVAFKTLEPFQARVAQVSQAPSVPLAAGAVQRRALLSAPKGLVMDYELVDYSEGGNWTFLAGHTYVVSNTTIFLASATFEGGAVIKYKDASLFVGDEMTCSGSDKIILTAYDDDSAGQTLPHSTGIPVGNYASSALWVEYMNQDLLLENWDIRYAQTGVLIADDTGYAYTVDNSSFFHCEEGVVEYGDETVSMDTVDLCDVDLWYDGDVWTVNLTECAVTDHDSDGMADSWEEQYFGGLSQSASGDYDNDGTTNALEYANATDPNKIVFSLSISNRYVTTASNYVHLSVARGVPSNLALLVDSTNLASATWVPYGSSNVLVSLGSSNATHEIRIGLRGRMATSKQTWLWTPMVLDTVAPTLSLTNLATIGIGVPTIRLAGFVNESLGGMTFGISNAAGISSNLQGFLIGEFYDTNQFRFTTNYFQTDDLALASGTNAITVSAFDLAGNLTTTNIVFNYAGNTSPPVFALVWPSDGTAVSGDHVTLMGTVNDTTASVTVTNTGGGTTNVVSGLVERNGQVWVTDLPLAAGTNTIIVTALNNAGSTNVTVRLVRNDLGLTLDPLDGSQLNTTPIGLSGNVGNSSYQVIVNGVAATVDGGGSWTASGVPVAAGGTAVIRIDVKDGAGNLLASQTFTQVQPPMVQLMSYSSRESLIGSQTFISGAFSGKVQDFSQIDATEWNYSSGGNRISVGDVLPHDAANPGPSISSELFAAGENGISARWEYADVKFPYHIADGLSMSSETKEAKIQSRLRIVPSGQQSQNGTNVYLFYGSAMEFSNLAHRYGLDGSSPDSSSADVAEQPDWLQFNGSNLIPTAETNSHGAYYGVRPVLAAAGASPEVTLVVTQVHSNKDLTLESKLKLVTLESLTVVSNTATQIDATNWAVVKSEANEYVIVQANFGPTNNSVLTNLEVLAALGGLIQWTNGQSVLGHPFQWMVTKTNSVKTTVTASFGSSKKSLNVWVIWTTITNQYSGATPENAQALWTNTNPSDTDGHLGSYLTWYQPGYDLGIQFYTDMTNHPAYSVAGTWAYGRECMIATVTPTGVNAVVTNGWQMIQQKMVHEFMDGAVNSLFYTNNWDDDTPHSWRFTPIPDSNDKLYAIDAPGIGEHDGGGTPNQFTNSYEIHQNYQDFVQWNGAICSSTNYYWHFEAGIKNGQNPLIQHTNLGTGLIVPLPTSAQY